MNLDLGTVAKLKKIDGLQRFLLHGQNIDWDHVETVAFHGAALKHAGSKGKLNPLARPGQVY